MEVRRGMNHLDLELLWLDARDDIKSVECYALGVMSVFPISPAVRAWYHDIWKDCRPAFLCGDSSSLYIHRLRLPPIVSDAGSLSTKTLHKDDQPQHADSRVPDTRQGVTGRKPANPVKIVGHTVHTTTARTPHETSADEDVTPQGTPRDIPGTTKRMPVFVQSISCVASPTIVGGAVDFSTATTDSRPSDFSALINGKKVHKAPLVQESHQKTRNHRMSLDLSAAAMNNKDPVHHTHQEPTESVNPKTPVPAIRPPASARYVFTNHYRLQTATDSNVNITSRTMTIDAASAPSSPPHARPIGNAAATPSTPVNTDTPEVDARRGLTAHVLATSNTIISKSRTGGIGETDKSDDLRRFDVIRVSDHSVSNIDDSVLPEYHTLHGGPDLDIHTGDFAFPDDQESMMDTGNCTLINTT